MAIFQIKVAVLNSSNGDTVKRYRFRNICKVMDKRELTIMLTSLASMTQWRGVSDENVESEAPMEYRDGYM